MFRRRTATLVATTPASSVATIPIQKTPPVTRRSRLTTRGRERVRGTATDSSALAAAAQAAKVRP